WSGCGMWSARSSGWCWSSCCSAFSASSRCAWCRRSTAATPPESPRRPDTLRARPPRPRGSVPLGLAKAVGALQALLGAWDEPALQLLEVRDPGHDVMALGGMPGLQALERPLGLLLVLHELLHEVPHRVHRGVGSEEGDEDEAIPELAELAEGERVAVLVPPERGGVVEGEGQVRVGLLHRARELDGGSPVRVRQLGPDEVHPRVGVGPPAPDRLLHAAAHRP